jgi:hypothetical protein
MVPALAAAPCLLLLTAAWMRSARGPAWLAFNFDPTYADLLNSLTILKGYPPFLIHHPGLPLQAIGSLVMAAVYGTTGTGTLVSDVVARPETYIFWIHAVALVTAAGLVAAAGQIAWRSAGLAAALLVQSGPWLSVTASSLAGQMRAELLIAGTAALWAAFVVSHVMRPTASNAARLSVVTGVTLALHMSAVRSLSVPSCSSTLGSSGAGSSCGRSRISGRVRFWLAEAALVRKADADSGRARGPLRPAR